MMIVRTRMRTRREPLTRRNDSASKLLKVCIPIYSPSPCRRQVQTADESNRTVPSPAMKRAYLSPVRFLSASDLSTLHPSAFLDPSSPINTLIKTSNLATFLFLIHSSAPDPETGDRPKEAAPNLREAANAFLGYIVPVETQLHDGLLQLLVGIKCQVSCSPSSSSRQASGLTSHPPL